MTTLVEPYRPRADDDDNDDERTSVSSPASPFVFAADGPTLEPVAPDLRAEWATYAQERIDAGFESVNSAYYISAEGAIVGRYVKANLWHSERFVVALRDTGLNT